MTIPSLHKGSCAQIAIWLIRSDIAWVMHGLLCLAGERRSGLDTNKHMRRNIWCVKSVTSNKAANAPLLTRHSITSATFCQRNKAANFLANNGTVLVLN